MPRSHWARWARPGMSPTPPSFWPPTKLASSLARSSRSTAARAARSAAAKTHSAASSSKTGSVPRGPRHTRLVTVRPVSIRSGENWLALIVEFNSALSVAEFSAPLHNDLSGQRELGTSAPRCPPPFRDRREKFADKQIEEKGLFEVWRVPGERQHDDARMTHGVLDEQTGVHCPSVPVADHHERRHDDPAQFLFHLEDRLATAQDSADRRRRPLG